MTMTNTRTSLKSIHLIQQIIRESNLLLLWLRSEAFDMTTCTHEPRFVCLSTCDVCHALAIHPPTPTNQTQTIFPKHSPLSTVVSRLSSELLDVEGMLRPPTPDGLAAGVSDYDLKKHLEDLVDHVAALKEQTASLVS
jgi:hypothetical protein